MTAAPSGEVGGALWLEINMTERLWLIPDERMKAGREHRIPLSDAAMPFLKECKKTMYPAMYSPVSSKISRYRSLTAALKRMGVVA